MVKCEHCKKEIEEVHHYYYMTIDYSTNEHYHLYCAYKLGSVNFNGMDGLFMLEKNNLYIYDTYTLLSIEKSKTV